MKTHRDFCYWLQGFLELHDEDTLTEFQLSRIKAELDKVFAHSQVPPPGTSQTVLQQYYNDPYNEYPRNINQSTPATNPLTDDRSTWAYNY